MTRPMVLSDMNVSFHNIRSLSVPILSIVHSRPLLVTWSNTPFTSISYVYYHHTAHYAWTTNNVSTPHNQAAHPTNSPQNASHSPRWPFAVSPPHRDPILVHQAHHKSSRLLQANEVYSTEYRVRINKSRLKPSRAHDYPNNKAGLNQVGINQAGLNQFHMLMLV